MRKLGCSKDGVGEGREVEYWGAVMGRGGKSEFGVGERRKNGV